MDSHWVWATDADTKKRISLNLSAVPCMMPVVVRGETVTALFFGGLAVGPDGVTHYAQVRVVETPQDLFSAPKIKARAKPSQADKLAAPHKTERAA